MSHSPVLVGVALLGSITTAVAQDVDAFQLQLDERALNSAVTTDCAALQTSRTMQALGDTVVVWYGRIDPAQQDDGKALESAIAAKQCLANAGIGTELRNEDGTTPVTFGGLDVAHIQILSAGPTAAIVVLELPRDFSIIDDDRTFRIYDARVGRWAAAHFAYRIGQADRLLEVVR